MNNKSRGNQKRALLVLRPLHIKIGLRMNAVWSGSAPFTFMFLKPLCCFKQSLKVLIDTQQCAVFESGLAEQTIRTIACFMQLVQCTVYENTVYPDQSAFKRPVWSRSTLFDILLLKSSTCAENKLSITFSLFQPCGLNWDVPQRAVDNLHNAKRSACFRFWREI